MQQMRVPALPLTSSFPLLFATAAAIASALRCLSLAAFRIRSLTLSPIFSECEHFPVEPTGRAA